MRHGSEFARIDLLLGAFREAGGRTTSERVPLGPGDDAALLSAGAPLAVTTDALVENVHFRRAWATWEQIGFKAVAVNLSDLAAMGARPTAFTCALTLPPDVSDDDLAAFARGMARCASRWDLVLAGGNFSRGAETNIAITAFGECERPLRRDKARPGDSILLIGDVGVAAAELSWLEADRPLPPGRSALLEPEPLIAAGLMAAQHAACAIDISDGLTQDLGHVAEASRVAIHLSLGAISMTERFTALTHGIPGRDRLQRLLAGGEDYALAIVGAADSLDRIRGEAGGRIVGRVEAGQGVHIEALPMDEIPKGHDHFRAT